MNIIICSLEYPPRIVGNLAHYVNELAVKLVKNNVTVYVITYHEFLTGESEETGIKIYRVTNPVRTHIGVLTWVLTLNQEVERAATNIYYKMKKQIDLIDVYDWHFIPAAVTLKKALKIPFIYSIYSVKDHPSFNSKSPIEMAINSIESMGFYEAERISAHTEGKLKEITERYNVPLDKISIISQNNWIKEVLGIYDAITRG